MSEHATATHAAPDTHAAHDSGHGTSLGVDSRKMGVWTFIGSETLFFAALIVTYLIYKPRNLRPAARIRRSSWASASPACWRRSCLPAA